MSITTINSSLKKTSPRETVQVSFDEKDFYEGAVGTTLQDFCRLWEQDHHVAAEDRAIAAVVDNRLRELTIPVTRDVAIHPVTLRESDGNRIYRRTLSFLLVVAISELFPGTKVTIDHAMPQGAFYCHIIGREPFNQVELDQVRKRMWELVEEDCAITRQNMPIEEARSIFATRGDDDKLRLLNVRTQDYLSVYELRGYIDYFFGYMAASTGYIQWFDLSIYNSGFALAYPRRENPAALRAPVESTKLSSVFQQTSQWLHLIGVEDIGQLNEIIAGERLREIVLVAEALQERRISQIAEKITSKRADGVRVVLIAGPSSSGKTTFSKRLAIQLMTHGLKPFTLEMDNYFIDREHTPRDERGEYDFESLGAMNVKRLNEDLLSLISGKTTQLPRFDFHSGKVFPGKTVQISDDTIIILEGIHGMNPGLTPSLPPEQTYRVYVSALTQLNIDRHNRVPTTDVRLIRRIVRDAQHRNYTAEDTLGRWASVRRGEKRNIFPYQEHADSMFNSALVYEMAVLRPLAEPLLLRVDPANPLRVEAHRLLSFLRWVSPMSLEYVPDNSILREFVGESILRDFHPGT